MRPKIIRRMVRSIDGRLLVDRWTPPAAGIDADIAYRTYEQVAARFEADGWIVGRKTMGDFAEGTARTPQTVPGDSGSSTR
jgi:5-amino-6-(5-phosphoribosylamino)uracil reductase